MPFGAFGNFISGGISQIASWMHDEEMQDDSQAFGQEQAQRANFFSAQQAKEQRDWQERMRSTQYQTAVRDMRQAGLNPALAYQQGGAGTPSGGMASASGAGASGSIGSRFDMSQVAVNSAQAEKLSAEASRTRAEEAEIVARTPMHSWSIAKMGQEISESVQRIATLREQAGASWASAQQSLASAEKLRAELPQVSAMIAQLRGLTALQLVQQGVEKARADELIQRIKANLPQAQRALDDLEAVSRGMALPGKQADEAARGSFAGMLGAYLRAILPIEGLIGAIPIGRGSGKSGPVAQPPINTGRGDRPTIHRR